MEYTIEDLRGKYVESGTTEAEIFLDACEALNLVWYPTGATPRSVNTLFISILDDGNDTLSCDRPTADANLKPFIPKVKWTIHDNTLPLCELTDWQYGKLMRAMKDERAVVEFKHNGEWKSIKFISTPTLLDTSILRIKPKSEKELFVSELMRELNFNNKDKRLVELFIDQLWHSGKVKLVKEGISD
ncbi:MAG: hypothetical protein ACRCVV_21875 [Shewanella sp.]